MEIMNFIKPELIVLVPVLYILGVGIKKSKIPDKLIPLVLGFVSVALCFLWVFSKSEIKVWQDVIYAVFTSVTQGILTAGASVYVNQVYVQHKKSE